MICQAGVAACYFCAKTYKGNLYKQLKYKDLTGEIEDRQFVVTRGDSRIAITLAKNEYTVKMDRETRIIVDDPLSEKKLAYILSKPLKVGHTYDENNGVFKFVCQEVTATGDDNFELSIANYYKYFPKNANNTDTQTDDTDGTDGTDGDDNTNGSDNTGSTDGNDGNNGADGADNTSNNGKKKVWL